MKMLPRPCPVEDCQESHEYFMCGRHWRMLEQSHQDAIQRGKRGAMDRALKYLAAKRARAAAAEDELFESVSPPSKYFHRVERDPK